MTFDLVSEPWIPVQTEGELVEVSLSELFERPTEFRDLAVSFGPERMALTRILAAVVMSAAEGPVDDNAKLSWLQDPASHASRVLEYLERWRERFDLFHPERPFMQQPIKPAHCKKPLSIAALAIDWASGRNVTLFDHHYDDEPPAVSPARAVRMLLTTLLYQPCGGASYPFYRTDSPGTKPVMVIALGRNLWQTLVGACPSASGRPRAVDEANRRAGKADGPAWERDLDADKPNKEGSRPRGPIDRLTWRSRAIQLLPSSDGAVRQARLHQHLKLADDVPPDPYVPVRQREGEEPKVLRVRPGRRLWRDADGIFYGTAEREHPTMISEAVGLFGMVEPDFMPRLLCVGLQVKNQGGEVADCREALLPVSEDLLKEPDRLDMVAHALEAAEGGAAAIAAAVKTLNERIARWQEPYWGRLREPFLAFVDEVASADDAPGVNSEPWAHWVDGVRGAAWEVMDLLWSVKSGGDDRAFMRLAQARGALRRTLNARVPKVEVASAEGV